MKRSDKRKRTKNGKRNKNSKRRKSNGNNRKKNSGSSSNENRKRNRDDSRKSSIMAASRARNDRREATPSGLMDIPTGCHRVVGVKKRTCRPGHGRRCRLVVDPRHLLNEWQDPQGPAMLPTTSRLRRKRAPRAVGACWPIRTSAPRVFFACHHRKMKTKTTTTPQGIAANRVLLVSHERASPHMVTWSPKSALQLLPNLPRDGLSSESTFSGSCRPACMVEQCFEVPPSIATRRCRLRGDLRLLAAEKRLSDPVGSPPSRSPVVNCPLTSFQLPLEGMLFCRPGKSVGAAGSSRSHGKRRHSWKPCASGRAR